MRQGDLCPGIRKGYNMRRKIRPEYAGIFENLKVQAEKVFRHCRQGSLGSKRRYQEAFLRFLVYVAETFKVQKLSDITAEMFARYARHRQNCVVTKTLKTDLAGIRFYMDQVSEARQMPTNEEIGLKFTKPDKPDRAWSWEEYQRMLRICLETNNFVFYNVLRLMYLIGLRIHEAFRIDRATAQHAIKTGDLRIIGKNGLIRTLHLNIEATGILEDCVRRTRPGSKLFVEDGRKTHNAIQALERFIRNNRDAVQDENRECNITPHGLRHRYARDTHNCLCEIMDEKSALGEVSKRLGHRRLDVVKTYLYEKKDGEK